MIGPALIDEFIKPYYTAIWDAAKNYGAKNLFTGFRR